MKKNLKNGDFSITFSIKIMEAIMQNAADKKAPATYKLCAATKQKLKNVYSMMSIDKTFDNVEINYDLMLSILADKYLIEHSKQTRKNMWKIKKERSQIDMLNEKMESLVAEQKKFFAEQQEDIRLLKYAVELQGKHEGLLVFFHTLVMKIEALNLEITSFHLFNKNLNDNLKEFLHSVNRLSENAVEAYDAFRKKIEKYRATVRYCGADYSFQYA